MAGGSTIGVVIDTYDESQLHKLTVEKTFIAERVSSETTYALKLGSRGELHPSRDGGVALTKTILDVANFPSSDKDRGSIRKLEFLGYSPVIKGQLVRALIPMHREIPSSNGTRYVARDEYKDVEAAVRLQIINEEGEILRNDNAADYHRYTPPPLIGKD